MQLREILRIKGRALYTTGPTNTLAEAVAVMTDQDVGSLVVFDRGRMVGMITFREVLKAVRAHGPHWESVQIAAMMNRTPVSADPDMEMDDLRRQMLEHHQRYVPVMEGDTLQGVVSFHDVAKAVLEEQSFENRMLKSYIRDWPADAGQAS
jgi:CBS domain-containing protein